MKKYMLCWILILCLLCTGCHDNNKDYESEGSWESLTWIINDNILQSWENLVTEEKIIENNEITWDIQWSSEEKSVWEAIEETVTKQSWFWVDECNRIIDFNLCVISKAPLENQPVMRESLQKAIESWKIMANPQLREVCQDVINSNSFIEVKNHYESLDDWCVY